MALHCPCHAAATHRFVVSAPLQMLHWIMQHKGIMSTVRISGTEPTVLLLLTMYQLELEGVGSPPIPVEGKVD